MVGVEPMSFAVETSRDFVGPCRHLEELVGDS